MTTNSAELKHLGYELDGVIYDATHNGFDDVCLDTIKRVRAAFAEFAADACRTEQSKPIPHILTESPFPEIAGRTDRDVLKMCAAFLEDMHTQPIEWTISASIWLCNEVQHALDSKAGRTAAQGEQAGSAEQVSEREALLHELDWCIAEGNTGPRSHKALVAARAALSAPERIQDETQLAIDLARVAHNYVENGEMRHDVGIALLDVVRKHGAPERKVMTNDDAFAAADRAIKKAYPGEAPNRWGEQPIPNYGILRAAIATEILNQQGEQTAPASLVCKSCGADRLQEGCKGDMLTCAIRGTAQKDGGRE